VELSIVMGVPPNGWFIMEKMEKNMENIGKPIRMDDLGVRPF